MGIGLGFEKIDRDLYVDTLVGGTFELGPVHLGVQAPLRWRVYNLDDKKPVFQLRKQDWDEVSDYFRILRFIEYGAPKDTFYGRLGTLDGTTIGHGTIMNWYYNTIDVNHWETGVRLNLNLNPGGIETVLNNVASPHLMGGRIYVRPWYFINRCSLLYRLAVGFTALVDRDAPYTFSPTANSDVEKGTINAPGRPLGIYGADIEYPIIASKYFDITPYVDNNFMGGFSASDGYGFHGGVLMGMHPPVVDIQARIEYRYVGPHYLPGYFDTLYEINRYYYATDKHGSPVTKLQSLDSSLDPDTGLPKAGRSGAYGELVVSVGKYFSLMAAYEDYQGPNNSSLQLRVLMPEIVGIRLGAYYVKRNFEGFSEIFSRDGALGILEVRYNVYSFISLIAQLSRQWRVDSDPTSPNYGNYTNSDSINFGIQFGWTF